MTYASEACIYDGSWRPGILPHRPRPPFEGTSPGGTTAKILSASWVRFRCKVVVEAQGGPFTADLRLGGPAGASVASSPKTIGDNGQASLVLAGDEHEGAALVLVVTDADGRVLAQQPTRKGESG